MQADSDEHAMAGGGMMIRDNDADHHLPVANISRIMKKILPTNAQVSKDTKAYIQLCVSEFISFVTSEASDKCLQEKRKTINGDDVLWALTAMGFDNYAEPLKIYLKKYREAVKGSEAAPSSKRQKVDGGDVDGGGDDDEADDDGDHGGEAEAK